MSDFICFFFKNDKIIVNLINYIKFTKLFNNRFLMVSELYCLLPNEVLYDVFSHLSPIQRVSVSRLNRTSNFLINAINNEEVNQETLKKIDRAIRVELPYYINRAMDRWQNFSDWGEIKNKHFYLIEAKSIDVLKGSGTVYFLSESSYGGETCNLRAIRLFNPDLWGLTVVERELPSIKAKLQMILE